jgi:putative flippase GtrA
VTSLPPGTPLAEPLRVRALRFGRSLIVGSGGTALDFAALTLSIRLLDIDATWARVIGLCVGSVVLFFGSRSFAFHADAESAVPQAKRFVVSELIGFPLNVLAFKLLLQALPMVAPELLSLLANFGLFITYYYPVRNSIVFKRHSRIVVQVATARP